MKKVGIKMIASIILTSFAIVGCQDSSYVKECPKGDIYKKHNFKLASIYTDSEGMYTDKCTYCGLEYRWNSDWECDKHYGSIVIFKNPSNGQDEYFIKYVDLDSGEDEYIRVSKSEIKKVEHDKEDTLEVDSII